ncbi:ParA family protein [Maridesulfovibrio bastinii]|uniref:ParA family protein n=1 Tax=Maridesulfovibrio bastinii TaxID=47157 RepID=UPI0003F827AC|nr:ParA family protein [Maridesulfovibrio bastinii]
MKSFACYNMKGGVGKTTSAVNFSYLAAQSGNKTLIWDLDPQGAATFHLGNPAFEDIKVKKIIKDRKKLQACIRPTPYKNLDIIPAGFEFRHLDLIMEDSKKSAKKLIRLVESMADIYDYFFFDCPPSISALSDAVFMSVKNIIMPMVPAELSRQTFLKIQSYLKEITGEETRLIPFFNMYDRRKSVHHAVMLKCRKEFPGIICENQIPARAAIERMGLEKAPVFTFEPKSEAALYFNVLWKEINRKALIDNVKVLDESKHS